MNRTVETPAVAWSNTRMGQIAVRDTVDGDKTVILVHGWGVDSLVNWRSCFTELGSTYRIVGMDLPGHGLSECTLDPSVGNMAGMLADLCENLVIDEPVLCGYSMGGAIVLESADLIGARGVVLAATAARFARWGNTAVYLAGGLLRAGGQIMRLPAARRDDPKATNFMRIARSDPRALGGALMRTATYDGRTVAANLELPAVSIITLKDHVVDVRQQLELANLVGSEIMEVQHGHDACFSQEFPQHMRQALARVDGGRGGSAAQKRSRGLRLGTEPTDAVKGTA